ncbi:MAG: type II toxin-antitoxin system RelE/ParE family toxin [Janthinobacterium lividum]
MKKIIHIYCDKNNLEPFSQWLQSFKDKTIKARLLNRLRRMEGGNLGYWKSVGEGVFELKMDFGSGYRIYFGEQNEQIIILLSGGDKSTQRQDIMQAQNYWKDYKENLI